MKTAQAVRSFLVCLLQMCVGICALGQEPAMRHYTVNDGLASSTVYTIVCDKKGFLWFCTEAGVSRYDGHKFTNFTISDGLSGTEMLRDYEDSKGRIWFLGFNGTLSYYYNGKFHNPSNDSLLRKATTKTSFLYFFEDKFHRLWFTADNEYLCIDGNKVFRVDATKQTLGHTGMIMNAGGHGVYILTSAGQILHPLHLYVDGAFTSKNVQYSPVYRSGMCYLEDGAVLFQSPEGMIWQKDTLQHLLLAASSEFQNILINRLYLDRNDKLWVTTRGRGVYCYDYKNMAIPPERYLKDKIACDVREDSEGNIWLSTLGDGIYMLPYGYNTIKNYNAASGILNSQVFSVAKAGGKTYAGLNNGIIRQIENGVGTDLFVPEKKLQFNPAIRIITNNHFLWAESNDYIVGIDIERKTNCGLEYYDKEVNGKRRVSGAKDISLHGGYLAVCMAQHILSGSVVEKGGRPQELADISRELRRNYCIFIDHRGTTWYGAYGGLYSYDRKEVLHRAATGTNGERISCIAETTDSVLVLATYGSGISLFRDDTMLARITTADGLSSNICKRIFVYQDEIYVATNNGASILKYGNGKATVVKKYTLADGLLSNDVNDIFVDDSDICVATSEGLSVISRNTKEANLVPPPVYIYSIRNSGRLLTADSSYEFSYQQNALHVDFIGISYRRAKDVRYQYRLDDKQSWRETDNSSVDFPFLEPGSYHFQLRARVGDGPWSEPRSFRFIVKPPFWKTLWFALSGASIFILIVILIAVNRIKDDRRRQEDETKIRDQIAGLEQQALQAMMNPHFIFNVMNSIQHYINNNEKHEANVYLADFARLIRMNLDISSKRNIPIDEEVAYLELYLSLERIRFGERLSYKIDVGEDIDGDETMIPVMLLQPFIENAIWHGILPKRENGHVLVEIKKEKGMLRITIADDGVGMPDIKEGAAENVKRHISRGMQMTQHRLDLIGRMTHHALYIHIADAYPGAEYKGTRVEFSIPSDLS